MPHDTDCQYPIRIWAFFEMIRPYQILIRICSERRTVITKQCLISCIISMFCVGYVGMIRIDTDFL